MGGACTCHSNIKKYFFSHADFVLHSENNKNEISKNDSNPIPEKNIKIIQKEDFENDNIKINIVDNSEQKKIQTIKNNNNYNILINQIPFQNQKKNLDSDKKRRMTYSNNISILNSENSNIENNIEDNNLVNNTLSNNLIKNENNLNGNSKTSQHKNPQKKLEKENEGKKVDTNFNYNLGEHNFIFINISRGSSLMKNEHESGAPKRAFEKENMEEIGKSNKGLLINFNKDKGNKAGENQIHDNNIILKKEQDNFNLQNYLNNFSKEMLNEINTIRKNPQSFLQFIDEVLNNHIQRKNDEIFIVSKNIDEKVKLMEEFLLVFEQIKASLGEIIKNKNFSNIKEFKYNKELEIDFEKAYELSMSNLESSINNDKYNSHIFLNNNQIKKKKKDANSTFDLSDDKIANLILDKRRQLKYKYPENVFKMSVIKDIKINILIQISTEFFYSQYNDRKLLNEIIFNPEYKNFAVSWANEINRGFISISCFA